MVCAIRGLVHIKDPLLLIGIITRPDRAVAMSSANGLIGNGIASRYPEQVFKGPFGRCKTTTASSFPLTSNRVTTNY